MGIFPEGVLFNVLFSGFRAPATFPRVGMLQDRPDIHSQIVLPSTTPTLRKKPTLKSPCLPMSIPQYPDTDDGTFNPYHYPGQVARGGWDAQVRLGLWILREGQLVRG